MHIYFRRTIYMYAYIYIGVQCIQIDYIYTIYILYIQAHDTRPPVPDSQRLLTAVGSVCESSNIDCTGAGGRQLYGGSAGWQGAGAGLRGCDVGLIDWWQQLVMAAGEPQFGAHSMGLGFYAKWSGTALLLHICGSALLLHTCVWWHWQLMLMAVDGPQENTSAASLLPKKPL